MDDVKNYPPYLDYPKERKKQTIKVRGVDCADVYWTMGEKPE